MNMEIIGPFILTIISGFSTLIGVIPIYFKIKKVGELISFTLSLSYFILLYISIFDLIPSSLKIIFNSYKLIYSILLSLVAFSIGYLIVYFLKNKESKNSLYKIGLISLISITLHNIPEGIIVFISTYKNFKIGIKTVIAIMLHNIPEGLLISIPLYYSKKSRRNVIKKILIASISEPFGALLSYFVLGREVSDVILAIILLFVSGIMISLCFNEIQKELLKYNNKRYIIFGFELSVILVIILSLLN